MMTPAICPLPTTMTFTLIEDSGSTGLGFSVTGTDGRWLTNGTDYSVQWYREEKTVDQGGVETGVVKPIDGCHPDHLCEGRLLQVPEVQCGSCGLGSYEDQRHVQAGHHRHHR